MKPKLAVRRRENVTDKEKAIEETLPSALSPEVALNTVSSRQSGSLIVRSVQLLFNYSQLIRKLFNG